MLTYRTKLRRFLADHDMAAVQALPYTVAILREYHALLNILDQLPIPLLVLLLDLRHALKEQRDLLEAFLARLLCESCVHIRPLVVLALRRVS